MSENVDYQNAQFHEAEDQYRSQNQIEPEFIQQDHSMSNLTSKSYNTGQIHASTMHDAPTQGLGNSSNQRVSTHDAALTAQIGNLDIADTAPTKRKKN